MYEKRRIRALFVLIGVAAAVCLPGQEDPIPEFALRFEPAAVDLGGVPGDAKEATVFCILDTLNNPLDHGVGAWSLSVATSGAVRITEASWEETDAKDLFEDGFRHFELTVGPDNEGFVGGMVLGFTQASYLPLEGSASIARLRTAVVCPEAETVETGLLRYRDGLRGLNGTGPEIRNSVVLGVDDYTPSFGELPVSVTGVTLPSFVRGDVDDNGRIALIDTIAILAYLFQERHLPCRAAADVDGDVQVGLSDALALLTYQFRSGPPPAAPYPECGVDRRVHAFAELDCELKTTCP